MKQPFELKKTPNTRLANNLKIALEALKNTRQIIPISNSYTQPLIQDKQRIKELIEKIEAVRKDKSALEECLTYFLSRTIGMPESKQAQFLLGLNLIVKNFEEKKLGNCYELCAIAISEFLIKFRVHVEMAYIVSSDHVIIIIDRDPKSDIKDVKNYGASCVILDVLNNEAYPASRIYQRLQCYRLDMTEADPHVLTPFTPDHQLDLKGTITCDSDYPYKKGLQVEFYNKLKVIEESINTYLRICKIEEIADLNKLKEVIQISKRKVLNCNLHESTNLEIEIQFSKEMSTISKKIFESTSIRVDNILNKVVGDMRQLYSSPLRYFGHLSCFASHNKLYTILAKHLSQKPKPLGDSEEDVILNEEHANKSENQDVVANSDDDCVLEEEHVGNKIL
ncbi:Uncharacterised protein [Legionella beliardensis]|uniref:Uncharacterized protein n=1 Tax=Legionella beliardensis TaxID=91822 RepID=A0A378I0M9_9GAMM|nr:hypothetical protein [Legionella beliardensis]STX28543.1 Uncharacterised protein [Legionella beliardensis]